MHKINVLPVGDSAVLVDLDGLDAALALYQQLKVQQIIGILELVPAAKTILVSFDHKVVSAKQIHDWLMSGFTKIQSRHADASQNQHVPDSHLVEIPVNYDGQDLAFLADYLGFSTAELIERHTGTDFIGTFAGFAPGFVYLSKGDPCFTNIPRLDTPRTRVPASSVAVAGDFSAIYPKASPGGWQLLGTTPERMWDLNRPNPAFIKPGDRVRFRDLAVSKKIYSLPPEISSPQAVPAANNYLEIINPGIQTLIQDFGRPGLTSLGVSNSGALDRLAMTAANNLVGNPPDFPVLENALGGLQIKFHGDARIAIVGAKTSIVLSTSTGVRIPAGANVLIRVASGNILKIGQARTGMRFYIALQGGFNFAPVLGSYATDVLAGIGPDPLRKGTKLPIYTLEELENHKICAENPLLIANAANRILPKAKQIVNLDIIMGPRNDWFTDAAVANLTSQNWLVTTQSNRVGLRLQADNALERKNNFELPSEGTVSGAIQVPASGQPVLFLADHPLTGGYPVIAVLSSKQLDLAGQIPIGALIKFNLIKSI